MPGTLNLDLDLTLDLAWILVLDPSISDLSI